jgi:N-acetylmuramoyl-L-alanine amidase
MRHLPALASMVLLAACSSIPIVDEAARYQNSRINHLVIHFTSEHFERSLELLTGRAESRVSVHYLVPEPGDATYPHSSLRVFRLVPEGRRAWHAGRSYWNGTTSLNNSSIGIEIVNRSACIVEDSGDELPEPEDQHCTFLPFPNEQIELVIRLAREILERNPDIEPENVIGHADIATTRRVDPGPRFPWRRLYENGIGPWPDEETVDRHRRRIELAAPGISRYQAALAAWGYDVETTGEYDMLTRYVVRAFQMRYRPASYDGMVDPETGAILFALLEKYRPGAYQDLLQADTR